MGEGDENGETNGKMFSWYNDETDNTIVTEEENTEEESTDNIEENCIDKPDNTKRCQMPLSSQKTKNKKKGGLKGNMLVSCNVIEKVIGENSCANNALRKDGKTKEELVFLF